MNNCRISRIPIVLVCVIIILTSTSYIFGEDNANGNDAKISEMSHFAKPKTVDQMITLIRRISVLFPDHLQGDQFGEDGVVERTALVLFDLVDDIASHDEFRTREVVSELLKLVIKFNKAVKVAIIPHFQRRHPAEMNVVPPPGSGIMSGGDPAEIENPVMRKKYLEMIDVNDRNMAINNIQYAFYQHMNLIESPTYHLLKLFSEVHGMADIHDAEALANSVVTIPK